MGKRTKGAVTLLDEKAIGIINDILRRGNTAEIIKRKDDIIILETKKKITYSVANL